MSEPSRTFAVVPAAGKSTRMGVPKLALPLDGRSVLEHVVAALRQAGISEVVVVLGPHVVELAAPARATGAHDLVLPRETAQMLDTILAGLDWLERSVQPQAHDAWLLAPADHPTLDAGIVQLLMAASASDPRHTIFVPTFDGRRGHPVLIGWSHVAGIRTLAAGQGLNRYLRDRAADTREVAVATPEILRDLDTPEDYQRLLNDWQRRGS